MPGEELIVDVTRVDDVEVLVVRGEIDMASAPVLRSAIERYQASGTSVLLDFAGVTFMDSSLCVRNASERVRRILELTGTEYLMCRTTQ